MAMFRCDGGKRIAIGDFYKISPTNLAPSDTSVVTGNTLTIDEDGTYLIVSTGAAYTGYSSTTPNKNIWVDITVSDKLKILSKQTESGSIFSGGSGDNTDLHIGLAIVKGTGTITSNIINVGSDGQKINNIWAWKIK